MGVSTTHRINLSLWTLIYSFSDTYYVWAACGKACNCVSIVFAFMCGRAGETILIRYVWTRPMGNVQYKWLSGDPRCLLAKQKYFSNKATRHSWVLKTCYYSEKGRKTDGNFNSILEINFFLRWMDRIKCKAFSTLAIHCFFAMTAELKK